MTLIRKLSGRTNLLLKKNLLYREIVQNKNKKRLILVRSEKKKSRVRKPKRYVKRRRRKMRRRITSASKVIAFRRIRRRLKRRVRRTKGILATNRSNVNLNCNSFFRRYLMRRKRMHRRLFYRTFLFFNMNNPSNHFHEMLGFSLLRNNIKYYEMNPFRKYPFRYADRAKYLFNREFYLGRVYITPRPRNTFISVSETVQRQSRLITRIIYKCTTTLAGYTGIKKKTAHARQAVSKMVGYFLGEANLTTIDIVFIKTMQRRARHYLRGLLPAPIYVRHLIIKGRRTHGFNRRKKPRRK